MSANRVYSESVKAKCIARIEAGEKLRSVAKSEKINPATIYNWIRKLKGRKYTRKPKQHVFTDLPVVSMATAASATEAHLVETAASGKYMVIICDLGSLKKLAASL